MTNKKLTILGLIAVILVVWAVFQANVSTTSKPENVLTYLIQGLEPELVENLTIKGASGEVDIDKVNGRFVVTNKSNYPAKVSKISKLIQDCLDIKIKDKITSNPENFDDLNVSEEKAKYIVRFAKADGTELAGLIVGDGKEGAVYVRKTDSDDVYLAENSPWLNTSPTDYMETELANVARDKVESVRVSAPGANYVIEVGDNNKPVLQDVPEGKKQKDSECNSVAFVLGSLRFSDVIPAAEMLDLNFESKYFCKLKDSTLYTFEIAKKGEDYFVKCSAEFTDETPVMKENKIESEEELKAKEAKLLAKEAALNFNKTHKDWIYKVQKYQAEKLVKPFNDLIEEVETESEEAAPEAGK